MSIIISSINDLPRAAMEFLDVVEGKRHFAFYGLMGAGKTTFVKAICEQLQVVEVVTSPTFALINEYHTPENIQVFHFDFYRINKTEELYDFGYEDYLFSPHYCFIEWPEKVEEIIPEHFLKVQISEMNDGKRKIDF